MLADVGAVVHKIVFSEQCLCTLRQSEHATFGTFRTAVWSIRRKLFYNVFKNIAQPSAMKNIRNSVANRVIMYQTDGLFPGAFLSEILGLSV